MAVTAVGCAGLMLGVGVVTGRMLGASWGNTTVFIVTDLTVSATVLGAIGGKFDITSAPQVIVLNITKFIASEVIGCLAGLYLNHSLFAKNPSAEAKWAIPAIHWQQAISARLVSLLAVGLCMHFFKWPREL